MLNKREKGLLYGLGAAVGFWWFFGRDQTFGGKRYVPGSEKAKELFRYAAVTAGLPVEWGDSEDLHYILKNESGGWVGRPNYKFNLLFGKDFNSGSRVSEWHKAWEIIRLDENLAQAKARHPNFTSRASGLGQLQPEHIKNYYPDKFQGVGDPVNEAVGMLRYIAKRYGSPAVARSVYGKGGKGDKKVFFTHASPPGPLPWCKHNEARSKCEKGFKEGY